MTGDSEGEKNDYSPSSVALEIPSTYSRISQHLGRTRLICDISTGIWMKCENEQITGSFKWRGALSKLSTLTPGQTIVTASTGNHGLAVANASKLFQLQAKIFVPANASVSKIEKIKSTGAEVITIQGDSLASELAGKQYASSNQLEWVSPYNDVFVIAGQGTIGLEIDAQLGEIDKIYITVGGGGLISGVASWMRQYHPKVEIIGCQPINSPEMYLSILSGQVVTAPESKETLSDGSAGPLEEDSITFPLCADLVDRFILVSEEEIEDALRHLHQHHMIIAEGAAGVAFAAAMKDSVADGVRKLVILCGGNISPDWHQKICRNTN